MNELTFTLLLATAAITGGEGSDKYVQAFIQQAQIDQMAQEFEKRNLSEYQRKVAGNAFLVGQILVSRQITAKWSF